jgi:hypothetical protein
MSKYRKALVYLFLLITGLFLLTLCKKEEIVIVYSKVNTVGTSNTTSMTTDVEGNIVELSTAVHNEYGICWDTVADPTVYKNKLLASGTAVTGSYRIHIEGLYPARTYHVRAFVKDNKKYIYGSDLSFTTANANLPVVTSISVYNITSKFANAIGEVTSEGDRPVIARGVCFDTLATPTIHQNKTMDGWGTGSFTSALINLFPGKTYYLRAYAVSEFGVSYGDQLTFNSHAKVYSFHEEFDNNNNKWHIGTDSVSSFDITGGQYRTMYHETGYLWLEYINLPEFVTAINSNDFEISTSIFNSSYSANVVLTADYIGGLIWDSDDTHFKYFGIKKHLLMGTITYYYTIGSYSGSYSTWKDYTTFTGSASNKLTIKKGNGYYYFFINDIQVFKYSFSNLTYNGVGFFIQDASITADYLYFDQKGDGKSLSEDFVQMKPGESGKSYKIGSLKIR